MKTREEKVIALATLRAEAEELTKAYNEAVQTGNFEVATKTDEEIDRKVNEYTSIVKDLCFEDCKNDPEGPMMAAIKMLSYVTIGTKDTKEGDDKVPVREIVEKERPIDLFKLEKHCGSIGADKAWSGNLMNLNYQLTLRTCKELGISTKGLNDSYAMSAIARTAELGIKDPTSNTQLLKALQAVVTSMLGEGYKVISKDVNYLLMIYTKKSRKALSVTCANHRHFASYIAEVCHRSVLNKSYSAEYRTNKESASAAPAEEPKAAKKAAKAA